MKILSTISLAICFTINLLFLFSFIICLALFLYQSSSVSLPFSLYFCLKIFMRARRAREVIVCCEILFWDQPRWSFYCRFDKSQTFALSSWKFLLCRFQKSFYTWKYILISLYLKMNPPDALMNAKRKWYFVSSSNKIFKCKYLKNINQTYCYTLLNYYFKERYLNIKYS